MYKCLEILSSMKLHKPITIGSPKGASWRVTYDPVEQRGQARGKVYGSGSNTHVPRAPMKGLEEQCLSWLLTKDPQMVPQGAVYSLKMAKIGLCL